MTHAILLCRPQLLANHLLRLHTSRNSGNTIHSVILQAETHAYLGAALVGLLVHGTPYFLDIVLGALLQIAILELLYSLLVTSSRTCGGVLNTMIQVRQIAI